MSERLFFLVLSLLILGKAWGQPAHLDFSRIAIDTQEGPNSQNIKALLLDRAGFLWIGTQNGVKRHDGIRSVSLTSLISNDSLLTDGIIEDIEEFPSSNQIWIATQRDGIYIYQADRNSVLKLTGIPQIDSSTVSALYLGRDSSMWIGTAGNGLIRYRGDQYPVEHYFGPDTGLSDKQSHITSIIEPANGTGNVFIGTKAGFVILETLSAEESLSPLYYQDEELGEYGIVEFAMLNGHLWGITGNGLLFLFDLNEQRVTEQVDLKNKISVERVFTMLPSSLYRHTLWVGTRGSGLLAYNVQSEILEQYTAQLDDPSSLSHTYAVDLVEGNNGVLWVGAFEGLNKSQLSPPIFTPHKIKFDNGASCANQPIIPALSFLQSKIESDIVWIGTLRGGLHRYDIKQDKFKSFLDCGVTPPHVIFSMHEDVSGNIWLGTDQPMLYRFDLQEGTLESFPTMDVQLPNTYHILELSTRPGYLWLATSPEGLLVFDANEGKVIRQYNREAQGLSYLPSNKIWRLMEDPYQPSMLWIATHDAGLFRLDVTNDSLSTFDTANYPCLPSDRIVSIAPGPDSTLWLGTFNKGFTNFDWQSGSCTPYSESDGLPGHDVGSIMEDRFGRLWLTTSTKGLSVFDPEVATFTNFTEEDGLQSNHFYYPASYQNERGEIFVGGTHGFNFFHPDSIQTKRDIAPVHITQMTVLGETQFLEPENETDVPLKFSHKQNDITFQFAALDLSRPELNQYRVKLEPIDKEWQKAVNGESPRYATLKPGDYTFKVMGSNSDGVWNPVAAMASFSIIPPVWGRWWFFPALSLLVIAFVVSAFQYRIYHLNLEKNARSQIARDLHDDMGSKLGSLALQIEMTGLELQEESMLKRKLSELAEAERALVNDLRLIVWLVNFKFDTLPKLVDRMEQEAGQMLRGRRFTFNIPDAIPDTTLDMARRKHIFLFFKETLHNIVRHSEAKYINIDISITDEMLHLSIKDDGVGFDESLVTKSQGLISLEVRAKAIQATRLIESTPGKGTRVTLKAPLQERQHWNHVFTGLLQAPLQINLKENFFQFLNRRK